ncbi:MAG: LmeA family phospholipid-binding protein [Rhodoglobus sp.]|nr:LmeA family phospholipid-binding protein [Rhodoglobus sp.]
MAEPIAPLPSSDPAPEPTPIAGTALVPVEPFDQPPAATPRKRRRWWVLVVVLLLVLVLLGIAYFAVERFGRDYAEQLVRDQVVLVLGLEPDAEVGVDLGPGSLIAQAIAGSIDTVTVDVAELSLGDVTASALLFATGVPLDSAKPVDTLRIVATVSEANVNQLAGYLSASELRAITLGDQVITAETEFSVFGLFVVPVTVDLVPSAVNGGISFDPKTIVVAGAEISVEDLRNSPEFSALAGDLLASRDFCVADQLPTALVLADVTVVGSTLVLEINGDGVALGDPALSEFGTCKEK